MNRAPTVSVIVPTYNCGRFIADALASILAQTVRDFEVIVIDDGSTDDTWKRVQAFGPSVKYIYQPNAGVSAARNTGIQASRGLLIAFLDADDVWLPQKLERQVAVMEDDPGIGVVYSWWGYMDEAGTPLPQTQRPTHHGQVFEELLRGIFVLPSMWLIRRACFNRVGLFDPELRFEDWDLLLRIAAAGYPFACVPEILAHYRLHTNSLSSDVANRYQRRALAKALAQLTPDARRTLLRKAAYWNLYASAAADALTRGSMTQADAWLAKAIRLRPGVCGRPGFYLGVAFALLPAGHRTISGLRTRLDAVTVMLMGMTDRLFSGRALPRTIRSCKRVARSALLLALAILYARCGRWLGGVSFLGRSLAAHPLTTAAALGRGAKGHWRTVRTSLPL
jgi:glycosyltransferase involved in cell wall biosynthesis